MTESAATGAAGAESRKRKPGVQHLRGMHCSGFFPARLAHSASSSDPALRASPTLAYGKADQTITARAIDPKWCGARSTVQEAGNRQVYPRSRLEQGAKSPAGTRSTGRTGSMGRINSSAGEAPRRHPTLPLS